MTYTVKNGTWCKDNTGEYLSTTLTGLKAMRKAGQVPEGTRVVVHEPKYNTGDLVKSFNPNCPEGCFVPDGSAFDTEVYTDLATMFPDGKLPDLRECALVMVGRSDRAEIANHDEYTIGQFKDDQFAEHNHSVTDTGHDHSVTDPGHDHSVTDPGHTHGRGTQNITGQIGTIGVDGAIDGAFYESGKAGDIRQEGEPDIQVAFDASRAWTGRSTNETTGISIDSDMTGISINSNTTGISVDKTGTGSVTHGKQVGVYFYIAF